MSSREINEACRELVRCWKRCAMSAATRKALANYVRKYRRILTRRRVEAGE